MDFVPLAILLIVFALIARRTVGGKRLQIWEIMSLGALGALVFRPDNAARSL
jgi:hypothetical protein